MNQDPFNNSANSFDEQAAAARDASRRLKRNMLIVIACMIVFAILATSLINLIDGTDRDGDKELITSPRPNSVIFFDPDYDYDITKDSEYLAKDRAIYYCDLLTGVTEALDNKSLYQYGDALPVLKKMIDCIIAGDADGYNKLFSSNYFSIEGREPEEPFTMQQVYDIRFTKVAVSEKSTEAGKKYTQYEYEVEYKIHKNNGTFRTDIGHDDSRKQYFVLSDSTGENVLIDQILIYTYK